MEKTGDVVTRLFVAEEVGFEPTVPVDTAVFETARFGRSRTPPWTSLPWRSWTDLGTSVVSYGVVSWMTTSCAMPLS